MPIYEYRCAKCGEKFEKIQRFSDAPLTEHEECGGAVERLISTSALMFKGSGFYITDYAKSGSKPNDSKSESKSDSKSESKSGESKSDSKSDSHGSDSKGSESKSESKSEPKSESKSESKSSESKPAPASKSD